MTLKNMSPLSLWKKSITGYSSQQFALFRFLLGLFLCCYYLFNFFPLAEEMFSQQGIFPQQEFGSWKSFPNLLFLSDSILSVQLLILSISGLSLLFALGIHRKPLALLIWYFIACLLSRNYFLTNPTTTFSSYLLLYSTLVPSGEGYQLSFKNLRFNKASQEWRMPQLLYWGLAWVLGMAYLSTSLPKFSLSVWQKGNAARHLLLSPRGADNLANDLILSLPEIFLQVSTWFILAGQVLFLVLFLIPKTRLLIWTWLSLFLIGVAITTNLAYISLAVLLIHLFLFRPEWLRSLPIVSKKL